MITVSHNTLSQFPLLNIRSCRRLTYDTFPYNTFLCNTFRHETDRPGRNKAFPRSREKHRGRRAIAGDLTLSAILTWPAIFTQPTNPQAHTHTYTAYV